MIVIVTRDDLRDEFIMADEAFALSPISARATQPREEDYNAISEAFMETSRGRWFLGEYAKRNRNADTRMVLDAVARIEETIAAQKKPVPDNRLPEALAAIKAALAEARAAATAALGDLALEENLAPARKGARVIREIAWRLREIGADGRICDLIDSQVSAIEGACGTIAATDPMPALGAAFDLIGERIRAFDASEPPAAQPTEKVVRFPSQTAEKNAPAVARAAEEPMASPAPAAQHEAPAATETAPSTANDAEAAISPPAVSAEPVAGMAETTGMAAKAAGAMAEVADPSPESADVTDDAEAHDNAVLDMVALEMAAPDPDDVDDPPIHDAYEIPASYETQAPHETRAALPPLEPIIVAERPEPAIARFVQPEPEPEPSLGSSLIASGIVRGPAASRPDPLAAIRRMSQAEKIAFFS